MLHTPRTVGIEQELLAIDRATRAHIISPRLDKIVTQAASSAEVQRVAWRHRSAMLRRRAAKLEVIGAEGSHLFELRTLPVLSIHAELQPQLVVFRRTLAAACASHGADLLAIGGFPRAKREAAPDEMVLNLHGQSGLLRSGLHVNVGEINEKLANLITKTLNGNLGILASVASSFPAEWDGEDEQTAGSRRGNFWYKDNKEFGSLACWRQDGLGQHGSRVDHTIRMTATGRRANLFLPDQLPGNVAVTPAADGLNGRTFGA